MNNTQHLLFESEMAQLFQKYNVPQAFLFYRCGENEVWKLVVDDRTRPLHEGIVLLNSIIESAGPKPVQKGESLQFVKNRKK